MTSSDVTVIGARRAIGVPIQAVLRDWTSLSLIRPVLVVDLDDLLGDGGVSTVVLEGGSSRPGLLQEELGRQSLDVVRFCAVSYVGSDAGPIDPQRAIAVGSAIRDAVPAARFIQAHLIVGSPGDEWGTRMSALLGWHNLALSPEESQSPDKGASPLTRSASDPRWLFSVVGNICSLCGLWPGQSAGVLDERPAPAGGGIVPVRSFVRTLAADAVEQSVAHRLFTFGDHYPPPQVDTGSAVIVSDEAGAALGMADALIAKYPDVMPRIRTVPAAPPAESIRVLEAMKQFFAFLGNAIRSAPRALAESLVRSVSAGIARTAQSVVFGGADSAYQMVVRGVRADGSPASWVDFESSLDNVTRRVTNGELGAPPQNPALWSDFVDGALTLLDAGSRKYDIPVLTQGSQSGIVSTTNRVAPSPAGAFRLPPQLAAFIPNWEVQPGDDINARRLHAELGRRLGSQAQLALDVRNEQHRLQEWAQRSEASYVGRVGRRLGDAFRALVAEIEQLEQRIQDLTAAAGMPDEIGRLQESLAKRIRLLSILSILVIVVLGVVLGLGFLSVLVGTIAIVAVVLAWLFGGVWMYMRGQQQLYQFLHRQKLRTTDLELARVHRAEALEDMRRITRAYRQYLDWARALGAFVHAPLGNPGAKAAKEVAVGQGLPRSIGVGVAQPDPDAVDEVANQWRRKLFRIGWLADAWREFLADVPTTLGSLRHRIVSEPDLLLQDQAIDSEGSVLTRWSRAVAAGADTRPPSQTFLKHIQDLTESDAQARDRLLSRVFVRDSASGEPREQLRREFNEGLDRDYSTVPLSFLGAIFSPHALAVDIRSVRDRVLQSQNRGLDSATVLVQLGGAYGPEQFVSSEPTPATTYQDATPPSRFGQYPTTYPAGPYVQTAPYPAGPSGAGRIEPTYQPTPDADFI